MDDPEVKAAKSLDDAFKVLKRKEEAQRNVALAVVVGQTFTAALHQCHNVEALVWLAAYTGELFDVICTDPPYGIGADKFGDSGGHAAGAHQYDDSYENWQKLAWAGVFLITIGVLALNILARTLFRNKH